MIKLKDLVIDAEKTLGSPLYLCKTAPTYAYVDGTPTSTRDGTRYTVFSPAQSTSVPVKVPGNQQVSIDGNALLPVVFDGLELYIYYRDGRPMVGARAKSIRRADKA